MSIAEFFTDTLPEFLGDLFASEPRPKIDDPVALVEMYRANGSTDPQIRQAMLAWYSSVEIDKAIKTADRRARPQPTAAEAAAKTGAGSGNFSVRGYESLAESAAEGRIASGDEVGSIPPELLAAIQGGDAGPSDAISPNQQRRAKRIIDSLGSSPIVGAAGTTDLILADQAPKDWSSPRMREHIDLLYQAGYISGEHKRLIDHYGPQAYLDELQNATADMVHDADRAGIEPGAPVKAFLMDQAARGRSAPGSGGFVAPIYQRAPKEELTSRIEAQYREMYGRDPTNEETARWVSEFRAREDAYVNQDVAARRSQYAAAEAGGSMGPQFVTQPPDISSLVSGGIADSEEAQVFKGGMWALNLVKSLERGGSI